MCMNCCRGKVPDEKYPPELMRFPRFKSDFTRPLVIGHLVSLSATMQRVFDAPHPLDYKFAVHLVCRKTRKKDIGLLIIPDVEEGDVLRNARKNGAWGREQIGTLCPERIFIGRPFVLDILATERGFTGYLNGVLYFWYRYLVDLDTVDGLETYGELLIKDCKVTLVRQYPVTSPHIPDVPYGDPGTKELPNPYVGKLRNELVANEMVEIYGKVKPDAKDFCVRLQEGNRLWPSYRIDLQIICHFHKSLFPHGLEMNALHDNILGARVQGKKPHITLDSEFQLIIKVRREDFVIYANGMDETVFRYRHLPLKYDTVNIFGDILIRNVYINERTVIKQFC